METIEFIAVIAAFSAILFWYFQNLRAGADGVRGLLAMRDDPAAAKPEAKKKSYRIKTRLARRAHELRSTKGVKEAAENASPAFRTAEEAARMRRKFRRQDEARYRVKDKIES